MDKKQERVSEEISHFGILGGNWNNAANSGSRNVNNNTATNSNTNIGARGVCDDE